MGIAGAFSGDPRWPDLLGRRRPDEEWMPNFQVNHTFLEDNAQSHTSPMSCSAT